MTDDPIVSVETFAARFTNDRDARDRQEAEAMRRDLGDAAKDKALERMRRSGFNLRQRRHWKRIAALL